MVEERAKVIIGTIKRLQQDKETPDKILCALCRLSDDMCKFVAEKINADITEFERKNCWCGFGIDDILQIGEDNLGTLLSQEEAMLIIERLSHKGEPGRGNLVEQIEHWIGESRLGRKI